MARPRAKKRTTPQAAATDSVEPDATVGASSKLEEAAAEPATRERGKRVKAPPKPKPETEYFDEKGNFVSWFSRLDWLLWYSRVMPKRGIPWLCRIILGFCCWIFLI
jgi:hypothetical protein